MWCTSALNIITGLYDKANIVCLFETGQAKEGQHN